MADWCTCASGCTGEPLPDNPMRNTRDPDEAPNWLLWLLVPVDILIFVARASGWL